MIYHLDPKRYIQDGEKLFNLERSFKIQGRKVVSAIYSRSHSYM